MAGNYTYDREDYASDPVFNFGPPRGGRGPFQIPDGGYIDYDDDPVFNFGPPRGACSAAAPSLSDQVLREELEKLRLTNEILKLKLKKLKKRGES